MQLPVDERQKLLPQDVHVRVSETPVEVRDTLQTADAFMATDPLPDRFVQELLTKLVTKNDCSYKLLRCELFQALCLRAYPTVNQLRVSMVASDLLPQMKLQYARKNRALINSRAGWTLSIDGRTTLCGISYYKVQLVDLSSEIYYTDLTVTEATRNNHRQSPLLNELLLRLSDRGGILTENILGLVSSRPDILAKIRNFSEETPLKHIIPIKCIFETINMMCRDVIGCTQLKTFRHEMVALMTFIKNCPSILDKLRDHEQDNFDYKDLFPKTINWSSLVKVCKAMGALSADSFDTILEDESAGISAKVATVLRGDLFETAKRISKIFDPLIDSIKYLESYKASITFVWDTFYVLNSNYEILRLDLIHSGESVYLLDIAHASLNKWAMSYTDPVYIVAFFLTPAYRLIAVSKHFNVAKMTKYILDIAHHWGCYDETQAKQLKVQVKIYSSNSNTFPQKVNSTENAIDYWNAVKVSAKVDILRDFALKLLNLVAHCSPSGRLPNTMSKEASWEMGQVKYEVESGTRQHNDIEFDELALEKLLCSNRMEDGRRGDIEDASPGSGSFSFINSMFSNTHPHPHINPALDDHIY